MIIRQKLYKEIVTEELSKGAVINNCHDGFERDYLVLHSLIKIYGNDISRFLEVGTNKGMGTKVIKNALGGNSTVYSLDLPLELCHMSDEYPMISGKDHLSCMCDLPFIQLRGDSTKFDYNSIYPIDGWFIDAKHSYDNVLIESKEATRLKAKLIVWHDADIDAVCRAITDAFKDDRRYDLFRVTDTRICYATRKK